MTPRIVATYRIETPGPLEVAAAVMAGEQSTATFVALPDETAALLKHHAATVDAIEQLDDSPVGSLTTRTAPGPVHAGIVTISFPLDNVGTALPNLLTTVAGNLFELRELAGIRLLDVEFPDEVIRANPGPAFGVDGTRQLAEVWERPIIGTIIKPSVGLQPEASAALVEQLALGGLDFVKDDELMADPPHSPFAERIPTALAALRRARERTGRQVMYAANVTSSLESMLRNADLVEAEGGTCVMVSLNSVGLAGLQALRERTSLPIHGHRNGWGALTRHAALGFSFTAYQKFWRLAGADHLHVNGLRNKFWEPDESVLDSARACAAPLGDSMPVMPVFSSGQSALQAADTYAYMRSTDLMYLCGGGIIGHPDGVEAGVSSVRESWAAAIAGESLHDRARTHPALRRALEAFGSTHAPTR